MADPTRNLPASTILRVDERVVEDPYHPLADDAPWPLLPTPHALLVGVARLRREGDALLRAAQRTGLSLGLRLGTEDDPVPLRDYLPAFGLIAVDFPRFTDGRGYTIARRLRERLGWRGELRAMGDVLADQLFYLRRCGFDSFALRGDQSLASAREALHAFSLAYQGAADDPRPLYRRPGARAPAPRRG